jgi:hypothetical protein
MWIFLSKIHQNEEPKSNSYTVKESGIKYKISLQLQCKYCHTDTILNAELVADAAA